MEVKQTSHQIDQQVILTPTQVESLLKHIENNIMQEEHFKYTVYDIYYEPINTNLISKVLKRQSKGQQMRLRSYGLPGRDDEVFMEKKEVVEDRIVKTRCAMNLDEAYHRLVEQKECYASPLDEFGWNSELMPTLFVGYERIAYCSKFDPQVRMTFSLNIRFREKEFRLCDLASDEQLFETETIVLTIQGETIPLWLKNGLDECLKKEQPNHPLLKHGQRLKGSLITLQNYMWLRQDAYKL